MTQLTHVVVKNESEKTPHYIAEFLCDQLGQLAIEVEDLPATKMASVNDMEEFRAELMKILRTIIRTYNEEAEKLGLHERIEQNSCKVINLSDKQESRGHRLIQKVKKGKDSVLRRCKIYK